MSETGGLNRRNFIAAAAAGAAGAVLTGIPKLLPGNAATPSRPNIIFILADDLAWGDLSIYGRSDYSTPNLDKLALQGTRFNNAYSNQAVCTPTRIAFYTGRYGGRLKVGLQEPLGNNSPALSNIGLPPSHPTIASLLKANGYDTALFGKWHCGYFPNFGPLKSGFNEYFGNLSGAADYYYHVDGSNNLDLWEGDNTTPVTVEGYLTDLYTDRAVEFVQRQRGNKPFYLSLHYNAPHWPWEPPPEDGGQAYSDTVYNKGSQWLQTGSTQVYGRIVQHLDSSVGRLLDALKSSGLEQNTLVIFTSDNGGQNYYSNFNALRGIKGDLFEGGIRVPAFIRWPGVIPARQVTRQVALTFDWTATILAATQTDPDPGYPLDGQNLLPVLTGDQPAFDRTHFWRIRGANEIRQAARDGNWKYVKQGGTEYLFNLAADIGETTNLKTQNPQRFQQLLNLFNQWNTQIVLPYP